ncbi:MAG: hypothetical protein R2728_10485 [Chitinophagales bacterium]
MINHEAYATSQIELILHTIFESFHDLAIKAHYFQLFIDFYQPIKNLMGCPHSGLISKRGVKEIPVNWLYLKTIVFSPETDLSLQLLKIITNQTAKTNLVVFILLF